MLFPAVSDRWFTVYSKATRPPAEVCVPSKIANLSGIPFVTESSALPPKDIISSQMPAVSYHPKQSTKCAENFVVVLWRTQKIPCVQEGFSFLFQGKVI